MFAHKKPIMAILSRIAGSGTTGAYPADVIAHAVKQHVLPVALSEYARQTTHLSNADKK